MLGVKEGVAVDGALLSGKGISIEELAFKHEKQLVTTCPSLEEDLVVLTGNCLALGDEFLDLRLGKPAEESMVLEALFQEVPVSDGLDLIT